MNKARVARSLKNAASKLKQRANNLEKLSMAVANSSGEDVDKRAYLELLKVKHGLNEVLDEVLTEFGEHETPKEVKRPLDPEVVKRIRAAFGSRPDLPPGEEYVERMKELWAGLLRKRDE
ncbi:MAG: hypothetical protein HYY02_13375 [Chloroflexi bacterium]|nr:hypothetical protein [Chloroflexota bacterium]